MPSHAMHHDRSRRLPFRWLLGVAVAATLPSLALAAFDPPQEEEILPDVRRADDQFAISVAIDWTPDEGFLVVGAFRNDEVEPDAGKAYVFRRAGAGPWTQMDELFAPDGAASERFGNAVAIDGDTLVISAPVARKGPATPSAGAVYVFEYPGTGDEWIFQQKLTASDGANGDYFGWAVAIEGDTIAVGALEKSGGLGGAYAFVRDRSGVWSEQGILADPGGEVGDFLGVSVDVQGDTIVAGAYLDTVDTAIGLRMKGSVSVFERSSGVWSFDEKVFSPGGNQFIEFGSAVALDGTKLAVGAPNDTPPFFPGQTIRVTGTVYRYDMTADPISSSQLRIWPSDKGVIGGPSEFGHSLGLDGNVLAIGAYSDGSNGSESGSLYLFDLLDNLLTESTKVTPTNPNPGDVFGFTVSVSGDEVAVGADREDIDPLADDNAGAAYVYYLPEPGVAPSLIAALTTVALGLGRRRLNSSEVARGR